MDGLEKLTIKNYLDLPNKISHLKSYKEYKRWEFFQQSFNTSIVFDGYEVRTSAIRLESAISDLDRLLRVIDQRIKINLKKYHYWKQFLGSLSGDDRNYFKYFNTSLEKNGRLNRLAIMEIKEIEEAINYQFVSSDTNKEIDNLASDIDLYKIKLMLN